MRRSGTVFLTLVCFGHTAFSQLPDAQQPVIARQLREVLNLSSVIGRIQRGEIPSEQLAKLALILEHTSEVEIHRLRGAEKNKTYLAPDGKQEAVYDDRGKLVKDGINDGSYNYFHPRDDALRHFTFDILPWLLLGQSQRDP